MVEIWSGKDKGKEGVKDSRHNMDKQSIMGAVRRPTSQNLYKCQRTRGNKLERQRAVKENGLDFISRGIGSDNNKC